LEDALRAMAEDMVARVVAAMRPMNEADAAVMVSMTEAARRLGISASKLKQLVASGEVRSMKVGDRRLVLVTALEALRKQWTLTSTLVAHWSHIQPNTCGHNEPRHPVDLHF
jgi:excisionase family DNA binding protein